MDVNFARPRDQRVGYLHHIRRETDGWESTGDGRVSTAIVQFINQARLGFLVFHTALLPDGQRLVERLRAAPHTKALITLENEEYRDTFAPVWVIGSRPAIELHLLDPHREGEWPRKVKWM